MKTVFVFLIILFLIPELHSQEARSSTTQEKVTLSGYVKDSISGESLIGATVYVKELSIGAAANTYGFYSLTLPKGTYSLSYAFIGNESITKPIVLVADTIVDMELPVAIIQLQEVEVISEAEDQNIISKEISTHKLSIKTIRDMPALGGEPDIIKSIQLLPGVTTVGEGSTGFFVRGGGRDQNLILLDEAPVYNASHLLGFLSVFNSDAINSVKLYKGGIPARYGGRASSILDIQMNEGNLKKFSGAGAIGPVGGVKLTLGAPINHGKGSFMLSGRRTYIDPFIALIGKQEKTLRGTKLFFYDFNAKVNYTVNDKNKLFISGYFGKDVNRFPFFDSDISWGNTTSTLRWNHLFSGRLFSNFTVVYSRYNYNLGVPSTGSTFEWKSKIEDINFKADFTYFLSPTTTFNFGLNTINHQFDPGSNKLDSQFDVADSRALEHGTYISVEKEIGNSISLEAGARWSLFQNIGETTLYKYDSDFSPMDTINYGSGEFYHSFNNLEPRFSARFSIDDKQSLKVSYNRMAQYLHLLANSSLSFTAFDIWYPSGPNIKPLIVDQVVFGYFRNFRDNKIEGSVEGYYKNIANQIDYKDFAQITFNPLLEGELRRGKAWSYGLEFYLKKNTGKLTGWLNYTWSRAINKIPGINNGEPFPATYDQPHKVTMVASYNFSSKLKLGANWTYNTGGAISLPTESYRYDGITVPVPVFTSRNSSRLPDYHRLDLSAKLSSPKNQFRKIKKEVVFSVYNAYARKNPLTLYVGEDLSADADRFNPRTVANKVSLFSIVPTVSVIFKF